MVLFVRAVGWLLGASLVTCGALSASAQPLPGESIEVRRIPRFDGAGVRVDGRLDEPAWRAALEIALEFESQPGDGIAPPAATRAFLVHDDQQLYIAFEASDPEPENIRANLMDRDRQASFEQDDYVAVTLDTFNDSRRGFEFRVNPRGVQMDGLYNQLEGRDFSWDMIWDSAGRIEGGGYWVELAIPFDQLRFLGGGGEQIWGIGLARSWPRDVLHRFEAHRVDRNNTCELCQFPRFAGFEGLAPGRHLELTPTLTYEHTERAPVPGADLSDREDELDAGASLRWGITPSLTLNATYNPDFSQIEADALQLATNQRFALFFEEKRPFFLEGEDIFSTQIQAVFTRTVDDPLWGLKLTGKPNGRSALGFFVVEDEVNNLLLPYNDGSAFGRLPGRVKTSVGRYRQDVGRSSTVGAVYTRRDGEGGYFNQVGGFDALLRPADRHEIFVQALASETTYPVEWVERLGQEKSELDGDAIEAIYQYKSRDWLGSVGWRSYDEDFRADAGFVPRVDFKTWRVLGGRTFWSDSPDDFFNKIGLGLIWLHTRDQEGLLTDDKWDLSATFEMPLQSRLVLQSIYRDERSGATLFEGLSSNVVSFEIQPNEKMKLDASLTCGDAIDYANDRQADERILRFTAEIKPGIHWNTKLALTELDLDVAGGRLADTRLADFQATYQFNMRAFVRAILQYVEIDFNEANDPSAQKDLETMASQLLFSYKINPQTLLFVGYSDGYVGLDQRGLEPERRTLFAKMSYAFTR